MHTIETKFGAGDTIYMVDLVSGEISSSLVSSVCVVETIQSTTTISRLPNLTVTYSIVSSSQPINESLAYSKEEAIEIATDLLNKRLTTVASM